MLQLTHTRTQEDAPTPILCTAVQRRKEPLDRLREQESSPGNEGYGPGPHLDPDVQRTHMHRPTSPLRRSLQLRGPWVRIVVPSPPVAAPGLTLIAASPLSSATPGKMTTPAPGAASLGPAVSAPRAASLGPAVSAPGAASLGPAVSARHGLKTVPLPGQPRVRSDD
ncbi:hypothetical protein NHX12_006279 [Muraenolepis orangiensis]|uniref:Uncharacterized protein n=1 Tax=Muraenolepis orangiensis TaxID=630683 RepID=A0A9Q0DT09_9TELE|nr:hypothetical protein NHX12_006279 [Muraenolepis orangiensis]